MNAKTHEKRTIKAYKIRPSVYAKAMRKAKKEKIPLATLVEAWIFAYVEDGTTNIVRKPSDQQLGA